MIVEKPLADLQTALNNTASGSTCSATGLYRVGATPLRIPAGVRLYGHDGALWLVGSRNWQTGGEAGNTWAPSLTGWLSSRSLPTITREEPGGITYVDKAAALQYEHVYGVLSNGDIRDLPFLIAENRRIWLTEDPRHFERIEVPEFNAHWFWPGGDGVTLDGVTMRFMSSGPVSDPAGSHNTNRFVMTRCVVGDCHGAGLNVGGSKDVSISQTLIERCGGSGLLSNNVDGFAMAGVSINQCGAGGWNNDWGGGATKFTGTTNHTVTDCYVHDCAGYGLWWDEACRGPIKVDRTLVESNWGPAFMFEISYGPVNVTSSAFAYTTRGSGWPVVYVSSSAGPVTFDNCLFVAGAGQGRAIQISDDSRITTPTSDIHWKGSRMILEGNQSNMSDGVWINDRASAVGKNISGDGTAVAGAFRMQAGTPAREYTRATDWNATQWEDNSVEADAATARGWRDRREF